MRKTLFALIAILLLSFYQPAQSADVPGRTDSFINDYAEIITENVEDYLENEISAASARMAKRTPDEVEIIVGTFPYVTSGEFDRFAVTYAEKWRETRTTPIDNGIVIIVAPNISQVTVGIGHNLRKILPQSYANYLINEIMIPEFRKKNYSKGIKVAVEDIIRVLEKSDIPLYRPFPIMALSVLLIVALLLFFVFRSFFRKK